jgi:hypothetical protein
MQNVVKCSYIILVKYRCQGANGLGNTLKCRMLRWAGHVGFMGRQGMHTEFWCGHVLESGHLKDREGDGMIMSLSDMGCGGETSTGSLLYWRCWTFRFCYQGFNKCLMAESNSWNSFSVKYSQDMLWWYPHIVPTVTFHFLHRLRHTDLSRLVNVAELGDWWGWRGRGASCWWNVLLSSWQYAPCCEIHRTVK